jgi:hydrogenase maturation protease
VLGLGNPMMSDDGVGCIVAERLAGDPRLPENTEVSWGGTDLLRYTDQMQGRQHVIIIDGMLGAGRPGAVTVFDNELARLEQRHRHSHGLSAPGLIAVLRTASPEHARVHFELFAIAIASAVAGARLSNALASNLDAIVAILLAEVQRLSGY